MCKATEERDKIDVICYCACWLTLVAFSTTAADQHHGVVGACSLCLDLQCPVPRGRDGPVPVCVWRPVHLSGAYWLGLLFRLVFSFVFPSPFYTFASPCFSLRSCVTQSQPDGGAIDAGLVTSLSSSLANSLQGWQQSVSVPSNVSLASQRIQVCWKGQLTQNTLTSMRAFSSPFRYSASPSLVVQYSLYGLDTSLSYQIRVLATGADGFVRSEIMTQATYNPGMFAC
jgi:hypothetical protein